MKYYPGAKERIGFDFYADIAVRVVLERKKRGLTQKQLTELLEWPDGKLQNLEAVCRRIMAQDLEDLSKALDVSMNFLLEAYDDSPIGDCLYLVWTDACNSKFYVEAPNGRMAVLKLEKEFKKSGVRMWNDARDRATVQRVGIPVDMAQLKDQRGTYKKENRLERGENE